LYEVTNACIERIGEGEEAVRQQLSGKTEKKHENARTTWPSIIHLSAETKLDALALVYVFME
jgi:hypothetical protein